MSGNQPLNNAHQGIDLTTMINIKIITGDDPEKFAKEFQDLVRAGWQDKGISQNITWSEVQNKFVFGFIATMMKQGVV